MAPRAVHTLIEPSFVSISPVRTDTYTLSSRVATSLTTLTMSTSTTATPIASDSPVSYPTSTIIPPLPADFASPLAKGTYHTPVVAIVSLIAIIIFGLIVLLALCYFFTMRIRGKCPTCMDYEQQLQKYQRGELQPITPAMVQERMTMSSFRERMRAWDLEKGGMDLQVKMHKDRMQSLVRLEGRTLSKQAFYGRTAEERTLDGRTLSGRADSVWSKDGTAENKAIVKLQEPAAAHLSAAATNLNEDLEATLVVPDMIINDFAWTKTHSAYLKDVVTPREAEAQRSLREAEDRRLVRLMTTVSDQNIRDSVQERAQNEVKEMLDGREKKVKQAEMLTPKQGRETRFHEHFSTSTINDPMID